MNKYLNKVFLIICYLYLSIVMSFSLTDDYRVFIFFLVFFLPFIIFIKKKNHGKDQLKAYKFLGSKIFIKKVESEIPLKFGFLFFIIILIGQIVFWLGYFPGGFNLDAYGQWMQAHNDLSLNDWHPFVSTLIIKFIIKILDSFAFYIFFCILMYALSSSLIVYELSKHGLKHAWIWFLTLYYSISPAICLQNICLTKDVQFTIIFNFMFWMLLKIFFSKGKWLTNKSNIVCMSILCTLLIFVRHNGVLFVAPLLLVILILYVKEKASILKIILLVICLSLIIKIPISKGLRVEPHDNVIGELVGVPMSIMANALVNDNENIPEAVHAFLNEIADDNEWKNHYIVGEWDSCKWEFGGTDLLNEVSLYNILHHTIHTAISCPATTYQSLKANTRITWETFETFKEWIPIVYVEKNNYGITSNGIEALRKTTNIILNFSMLFPISILLWNIGFQSVIILLAYFVFQKKIDNHILLLIIPLLVFNIGTTLLLAGPNYRYFYHTEIVFIPIFFLLFYDDKIEEIQ